MLPESGSRVKATIQNTAIMLARRREGRAGPYPPAPTANVSLGPAPGAGTLAASVAVPAIIEMPSVPSPVIFETRMRRWSADTQYTLTVPVAVPVLFRVTCDAASVMLLKPPYVTV